jgi:hypothetical protein
MGALVAVLVVVVWIALAWILWLRPVVDAARRSQAAYDAIGRTRAVTIWLILLAGWIGGGYYLVRIRPDLIAAEEEDDRQAEADRVAARSAPASSGLAPGSAAPRSVASSGPAADRELFVRNIPPEIVRTDTIPPASEFPPLRCSRQDVIDAVLAIEPSADTSQHRITVAGPGFRMTISIPLEDPLSVVLLRVHSGSDQGTADHFIGQLLARLDARAFDTESPTLVFSPPD